MSSETHLRSIDSMAGSMAALLVTVSVGVWLQGCGRSQAHTEPLIEFTRLPPAETDSPEKLDSIQGHVLGAKPGDRLVLYSLNSVWQVQLPERRFTGIQADGTWRSQIHPGAVYGAVLVDAQYRPPTNIDSLPEKGGSVLAVASARGTPTRPTSFLQFSGYQWEVRRNTNGDGHRYDTANAWTDERSFLHLRISKESNGWLNGQVRLSRSLGYGLYKVVVDDVAHLEPAAVIAIVTWDDFGPSREMSIEMSRWGQPENKNGQFVVQPWDVPANAVRFMNPPGKVTYWIKWEPGSVLFRASRGSDSRPGVGTIAEHQFTSGVPSAGDERLSIGLYAYNSSPFPLGHEAEIVIESFEYLP
jgi:hypothetical protein